MNTNNLLFLQKKYRNYRCLLLFMLVLLLTALIFVFINRSITLILIAIALAYHIAILRKKQKQYSSAVTKANLSQTLCKDLSADVPEETKNGSIDTRMIRLAALLPFKEEKGSPLFCWQVFGQTSEYTISLCDATFAEDFKLAKKGRKRVHFNSGAWVHIPLSRDTGMDLRILDETSVPTPIRMDFFALQNHMQTASIRNPALSERYVMYCDKEFTKRPSDAFMHQLKQLMEYTPGYVALSIRHDQLDLFVRGRFLARPVSLSKAPTQQLLDFHPFPELDYIIKLAKTL